MKGTIKLNNPVRIAGELVKEVKYDTELIGVDEYLDAQENVSLSAETSPKAHLSLGIWAAVLATPGLTKEGLTQVLKGSDIMKFADVGMLFTRSREESAPDSSEDVSMDMQSGSTNHPHKSEK